MRSFIIRFFILLGLLFPALTQAGTFTALTTTMTAVRVGHTATLLPDGKVLLAGGCGGGQTNCTTALNTAEVYDPVANTFTALTATMTSGRFGYTATLLPSGKVLITGGTNNSGTGPYFNTAEVYDPVANTFTALTATMATARFAHKATLLPNGKVLLTGGWGNGYGTLNTAEVYDPVANTFTALTATMTSVRAEHTSTLLPNGKVLLAGGKNGAYGCCAVNTAEVYDPVANTFTAITATMTTVRNGAAAALLPNGQVLLVGGANSSSFLNTAEVYDPVANTFTALPATMASGRWSPTATLLPNGTVLITGGYTGAAGLNTAEVYDALPPTVSAFTALTPTMTLAREGHTATLLPSGKVLIAGGENGAPPGGTGTTYNTAELYDPVANTFTTLAATMTAPREAHTATLLPNGKVLLAGGFYNQSGTGCLNTAELYDPVANTFTALATSMVSVRCNPAATLLPNGKVLITGGGNSGLGYNTAEVYDPVAQTFTALSSTMTSVRWGHTATLLPNGKVLITGGVDSTLTFLNTVEVYDPVANTFTAFSAAMTTNRGVHTATLLPNGKVLLVGGAGGSLSSPTVINTPEVYDPVANTFTALSAAMTANRGLHTATLLPGGQVLLTGGMGGITGPVLNTAEVYAAPAASQTIAFGAAPVITAGSTGAVSATATSGLPVTFNSLTTGICTVSGTTVTGVAAGICTIAANQAGNASYSAAPQVTQNITVGKGNQTISLGAAPTIAVGGTGTVIATATSGLAVTFSSTTPGICTVSGGTVTGVSAGACTIAANQAGDANYNPAAQVTQGITIGSIPAGAMLITPYVNESDMAKIQQIFNSNPDLTAADVSLHYVHDGLDIAPTGDMKPFRAACSGWVRVVAATADTVQVMIECNSTYWASYGFEPQSPGTGQTQLTHISVTQGQAVSQGDLIGYLYVANAAQAHVHFAITKDWVPVCPEQYFDPAASNSVTNLVHLRFPGTGMCHGGDPVPPPLSTPYVNESDMASINEAFSSNGSAPPWGFVHDGIDFFPTGNLKPFRAACSGVVDSVQLQQNNITSNWQINLLIVCNPYVNDPNNGGYFPPLAIEYIFEPMSAIQADGQTQLASITVAQGQAVSQGDVIGHLNTTGAGAHVHFGLIPFGGWLAYGMPRMPSCPESHFAPGAKASILNLLHVVWPGAGMCYAATGQSSGAMLNLASSWNLLGNSVNAPLDVAAAFGDTAKVQTVWKWAPTGNAPGLTYPTWAFYAPSLTVPDLATYAAGKNYEVLSTINGGEGFWVNAKTAFAAQLSAGTAISATYFQNQLDPAQNKLLKGWNLIATGDTLTPSAFNAGLSVTPPAQGVTPINLTTLWAWDSADKNWYFYAPSLEASGGLANYITGKNYLDFTQRSKTLGQGVGFWVNKP